MIYRKKIEQKRKKISLKPCEWMNGHLGFQEDLLDNKKIFSEQNCFNIIFKVWNQKLYNIILNWYNKTYFIGQPPFELSMMFHCADCTGKVVPQAFFLLHYRYKICINTASFLHPFLYIAYCLERSISEAHLEI